MSTRRTPRIRTQLVVLAIARLIMNTMARMVFPFLPAFARGLDVSVTSLQRSLSVRSLVSFVVPFLVPLSEKFGRKNFLYIGLLIFSIGCFIAWQANSLLIFTGAIFCVSLGVAFYDPIMRTHIGEIVPYEQRGKAVAISEFSWAGAILVGAPLAGLMIARFGWQSPFVWLGILSLLAIVLIWRTIPEITSGSSESFDFAAVGRAVISNPIVLAGSAYVGLTMFANMLVFSSYASWMEQQFAIDVSGLGVAAMIIGFAELIGEIGAGWLSDRFGKRLMVLLSAGASVIAYAVLPFTGHSLVLAWVALFSLFIVFEMSFICVVPLFTEMMPKARSVPLAILALLPPIGRALALVFAGSIEVAGGFKLIGIASAIVTLVAVIVFGRYVTEA